MFSSSLWHFRVKPQVPISPTPKVLGAGVSPRGREGRHLSDLLLQRRGRRAVLAALSLALAVAALGARGSGGGSCCAGGSGRVGDVGPAGVTQLLLLVAGLVLVLVVEHSLEVHDSPRVPGLGAE